MHENISLPLRYNKSYAVKAGSAVHASSRLSMTCQQPRCAAQLKQERSNRQTLVVPLSSSVPQVSVRGEKSTPGSVASFAAFHQPCLISQEKRDVAARRDEFCLCCSKCCTIEEVLKFIAHTASLLSSCNE